MGDKPAGAGQNAIRFLIIATAMTIIVNLVFIILPSSYHRVVYGTIQFLWPILGILALIRIYNTSDDRNAKFAAFFFGVALVPWTITLTLWELILPLFYPSDLAYYLTGFGYLLSYGILIWGLIKLKYSRQWYLDPSVNQLMNVIAALMAMGLALFIMFFVDRFSTRLPDIFILLAYLVFDIVILLYCTKLFWLNIKDDLRYLIMTISGFILINSLGDLIFELRWLLSLNYIFSIKTADLTDVIYNVALVFIVAALVIYESNVGREAFHRVSQKKYDTGYIMEDVVMQSLAAMCVCDIGGNITLINDSLLKLFNAKRPDLPGNYNLFEHMGRVSSETSSTADRLKRGDAVIMNDLHFPRSHDGSTIHLSVKAFPIRGWDGNISNYVFIVDNITERLAIEEELKEAKKQAELYVDLMGHDINNMNQIAMGFLEIAEDILMTEGKLIAEHANLLRKPIESLNNSSRLVDNVKKLQKVKSGQLNERVMDIGDVLREVIGQYERVPGRSVSVVCEDSCGAKVMANDLLNEVFSNLVGNAIKHSTGPLNIHIRSSLVDDGGKKLCRVVIEDNGPGIHDSIKDRIFDRSQKGNGHLIRKGLGLYLVNILVSDYGGTIRVEDRVQGDHTQGSRFVVTLPAV
jgi:PAS domain S-box-containing protein